MAKKYDFIIAGGGTSGIITATKLIEHGASVLILENKFFYILFRALYKAINV